MTKMEWQVGTLPSAIDLWIAIIAICEIFDKHVPWWVWALLVCEIISAGVNRGKVR